MSYWRGLGALRLRNPPLKWGSSPRPSPQRVLVLKPQIAVAALQRPRGSWSGDDNNPNRRFLDKVTRDPKATFNGTKDGPRFLTALRQYDDLLDLVFRLANPKEFGLKLLRESLTHLGDREGLNQHVVPFLAVLGSDTLAAATCRRPLLQVLEGCYRVPGLLDCMHDALAQDAIAEPAPIGWFLLTLASQVEAVREDEQVLAMAVLLEQCPGAAGKAGAELRVVLAGSQSASSMSDTDPMGRFKASLSLEDLQSGPGGRHDNDHQDYRSIKIVPSAAEVLCTRPPFLPGQGDTQHLASPEAAVLDRQFRLMREDMVQPLRQSLKALGFAAPDASESGHAAQPSQAPHAVAVKPSNVPSTLQRNIFPLVAVLGVAQKPRPCIMVAVKLPKGHTAASMRTYEKRLDYWTEFGYGTLAQDALMCLAFTPPGSQQQCIVFGTIARRDPEELAEEMPVIGLSLERGADAEQLMQLVGCGRLSSAVLVQVSTNFFSYEPLLKALQGMTTVPLAEEIVHTQEPSDVGYLTDMQIEQAVAARTTLDPTQQQAMRQALKSRVGLIQGPPGTGKTFVGALVADTIVQHSSERILVVCYTNHALDQFLEALLDMGITSMIRIGGKSKSTKLERYNLFQQALSRSSATESRRFYTLRDAGDECLNKMNKLEELLRFVSSDFTGKPATKKKDKMQTQKRDEPRKPEAPPSDIAVQLGTSDEPEWGIDLWKVLGPFLKAEQDAEGDYAGAWEQLKPDATWQGRLSKWQRWVLGSPDPQHFVMMNKGEAEAKYRQLQDSLLQFVRTAVAEDYRGFNHAAAKDIWALPVRQRLELAVTWLLALRIKWCQDLASTMARCKDIQNEITSLNDAQRMPVLKSARVIGCTATGAAKYKELLQSHSVAPSVVMVEEAGELHESHTLTSLSPSTKQLILIGDHKQLRPKVECYNLSVESQGGLDLNVSLFERLVTGGFPHVTLGVQHRMHPAISSIVRSCTYPQLEDHASVKEHPPLLGLEAGRRLVFIDHDVPEEQEQGQGWGNQSFKSKVNKHEVQMTVAIVNFLVQQGYKTDQLVVLTPYLGQLLELHKAIRAGASQQVALSELDMRDLRNAAQPQLAAYGVRGPTSGSGGSIRVSTIDNYQGEEADVVVATLVRCNDQGSVGFLKEPERINVLMSRARNGMILVGSAGTLRNAKSVAARQHWSKVLNLIHEGGGLLRGLPAQCQLHGTPALLAQPEDFKRQAPEGGCCLPCGVQMPCGHTCPLRCHALDREHKRVKCQELVYECCSQGHVNAIQCHAKGGSCVTCVELQKIREDERKALAKLQEEESKRRAEDEKQRVMLEAKIERLRQEYEAGQAALSARKEAVRLELEHKRLQAELELQSKVDMDQLAVWEKQQRNEAEVALQQMKVDAVLEAAAKKDQQHREALKVAQEKEKQLALAAAQLEQLQRESDRKLQDIENKKTRTLTKATDDRQSVEVKAQATAATFMTMGMWSDALAQAGTGIDGLARFKQQLQASADSCEVLDLLLQTDGIGAHLLQYVSTVQDSATATSPGTMGRGLSLIQDGKLLDALQFFNAQADPKGAGAGSGGRTAARALQALCRAKLGLAQPAAALGKQGHRKQLITLPMNGATAEARSTGGDGQEQREQVHPAQHLADAVFTTAKLGVAAKLASPVAASSMRADHAKAAGHALLFLLHPSSSEMPSILSDEARTILCSSAAVLGGDLRAVAAGNGAGSSSSGPSGAKQRQQEAWRIRADKTPSFKQALDLVGLAPVKQALSDLADQVDLDRERKLPVGQKQYNACFYGNPGTGKTTVARIYANVLQELGVLPDSQFVETSGAKLVQGGVNELTKHLTALDKGGVLFVDEAYQLNPKTNPIGAQVLDALLPEMENRRGKLVVVFAGYQKHMEGLMAHNEGLPSRFPLTFTFPDYSDEELHSILKGIMASGARFELEQEKHGRIAAARLGRQRGTVGFGNARAVRNLYERVLERQAARCLSERRQGLNPDLFLITREDLLGPKFLDVSSCQALADLQAMRGLPNVKQQVDNLLGLIRTNAELEEQGRPLKEVCLNRVLVGNPGTGKTTVASLYGRILKDLGLLSKGDVVVKVPADFTGAVLGESEQKTVAILDAAVGSVLVIDEAYGLFSGKGTSDPYKEAIIDTIVAKVQGVPGDDRCMLLLGYEDQMEAMMRAANPGLKRRFQWQSRWHFEDYTADDLLHIMRGAAKRRYDWDLGEDCLLAGVKVLEREMRKPNFGNAGAVNNLLSVVAERMETRLKGLDPHQRALAQPVPDDFDPPKRSDPKDVFKDLIGCKEVLDQLRKWQAVIRKCQEMGKDPLQVVELNFRFVGSPGTGKTTVARRVGMLFESLGLLASSEVLCCSASDFTTGYANQSSGKTRELFNKAVGGVLFIDEAYRLNPKKGGPMMAEVLDEIVQILTEERFMGKMVVILGGYEAEIDELLTINPGLKSRFSQKLFFPDFSCQDACALFKQQLQREYDLALSSAAGAALPGLMQQVVDAPGWSNGRDVITLTKRAFSAFSERTCAAEANGATGSDGQQEDPNLLSQADVTAAVNDLLSTKQSSFTPAAATPQADIFQQAMAQVFAQPPPPPQSSTATRTEAQQAPPTIAVATAPEPPATVAEPEMEVQADIKDRVWAALEEACGELGYSIDQIAAMLRPGGSYTDELLDLVMRKSGCWNKGEVVAALDAQKPAFLNRVELLIRQREQAKTEMEMRIQQKIQQMGVCCMGYQWLKVQGGWRCAGGSHYLSDEEVQP